MSARSVSLLEFAAMVGRLRRLQVRYLETRQRLYLESAKEVEKLVDEMLALIQKDVVEVHQWTEAQNVDP